MRLKAWQRTERIAIGGGFRGGRIGEFAINRAAVLLRAAGRPVALRPIRHAPDEAGLIGAIHLMPEWMFAGHDAIFAADIGGTKIRIALVALGSGMDALVNDAQLLDVESWGV